MGGWGRDKSIGYDPGIRELPCFSHMRSIREGCGWEKKKKSLDDIIDRIESADSVGLPLQSAGWLLAGVTQGPIMVYKGEEDTSSSHFAFAHLRKHTRAISYHQQDIRVPSQISYIFCDKVNLAETSTPSCNIRTSAITVSSFVCLISLYFFAHYHSAYS